MSYEGSVQFGVMVRIRVIASVRVRTVVRVGVRGYAALMK
jgi:hypothetical protein